MSVKGDWQRRKSVTEQEWADNYARAFPVRKAAAKRYGNPPPADDPRAAIYQPAEGDATGTP